MAPPPEYDKEPKAPDKGATNISCEETKALHNLVNDQHTNSDHKSTNTTASTEVENKHVETLDDGQLRALLDEAITYKCPKDREGKSSLFKELLEEVEQDEQACEAAARGLSGARARAVVGVSSGRGGRRTRALPHSNSLQDLVAAALAAEPAPRRHRPAPPVSARAIHGGSLPSGVDTSFLLGEEPAPRGGYLATVRCVNPPPLAERRVSASDANAPQEAELSNRRSKPAFPMTYTARATLEIGSGSVCSGRAVTTTTASNQVRTRPRPPPSRPTGWSHRPRPQPCQPIAWPHCSIWRPILPTCGPPERINRNRLYYPRKYKKVGFFTQKKCSSEKDLSKTNAIETSSKCAYEACDIRSAKQKDKSDKNKDNPPDTPKDTELELFVDKEKMDPKQYKLMSALLPKASCSSNDGGGNKAIVFTTNNTIGNKIPEPRGPVGDVQEYITKCETLINDKKDKKTKKNDVPIIGINENKCKLKADSDIKNNIWKYSINNWYDNLERTIEANNPVYQSHCEDYIPTTFYEPQRIDDYSNTFQNINIGNERYDWTKFYSNPDTSPSNLSSNHASHTKQNSKENKRYQETMYYEYPRKCYSDDFSLDYTTNDNYVNYNMFSRNKHLDTLRNQYRERVGNLQAPKVTINPKNIRSMTIGKALPNIDEFDKSSLVKMTADNENISSPSIDENISTNTIDKPDLNKEFITLSSNPNTSKYIEEIVNIDRMALNESARSRTPIFDQNTTDTTEPVEEKTVYEEKVNISDTLKNSPKLEDAFTNYLKKPGAEKGIVEVQVNSPNYYVTDVDDEFKLRVFSAYSRDDDSSDEINLVEMTSKQHENKTKQLTSKSKYNINENDVELTDLSSNCINEDKLKENSKILVGPHEETSFDKYIAEQQKLFQVLEDNNLVTSSEEHSLVSSLFKSEKVQSVIDKQIKCVSDYSQEEEPQVTIKKINTVECIRSSDEVVIRLESLVENSSGTQNITVERPNNAYVLLTLPQRLLSQLSNTQQIENNNDKPYLSGGKPKSKKKKKDLAVETTKKQETYNKKVLKTLLFENLFKSDSADNSISKGLSTISTEEVDSAIPFSCITTPEVVASCNTTSSTSQSAVAVDPKPRSVISSSINGLPLSRPNYGSTASTTQEEFKKSLDENGNSVQGFSSSLSGSSQHKKPRRKKSSKNETVIKSHQIDGYQGNKDLNEVLRFIESNAESTRAHKLGRAKHKDDSDDKGGKKRSTERRKEKENKMKRATSMEELSRTKLEDLTDKPAKKERWTDGAAPKAERRSWGDDAREAFYYEEAPPDADFQTVTKKSVIPKSVQRKPRRRTDEAGEGGAGAAGGRPRAPSPRARRVSAPPSDRSNDSNDDLDSVHSLPADAPPARCAPSAPPPPPAPTPVSYADIARTRHNIPDLIESCNFYAEGETAGRAPDAAPPAPAPAPAPADADMYPALEPRPSRRPRADAKPAHPPLIRRDRKERTEVPRSAECPAPDVVSDRRPPVILLDSAARPGDMDGVTFGFDINEQLLGGPTRRPRCDLVRDAIEGATAIPAAETNGVAEVAAAAETAAAVAGAGAGVSVTAGCAALRYVPPAPPPDSLHLHQIIDYVGAAWEDVVRLGKVRYFSE